MLEYSLLGCVNGSVLNLVAVLDCALIACVLMYVFANAIYIVANIGANAEILAFAFCECSL